MNSDTYGHIGNGLKSIENLLFAITSLMYHVIVWRRRCGPRTASYWLCGRVSERLKGLGHAIGISALIK